VSCLTTKERLLCTIRHKEPDRVPVAPRIWNFLKKTHGIMFNDWAGYKWAAGKYGFDTFVEVRPILNNYFRDIGTDYMDLPLVKIEKQVYTDGDSKIVKRIFQTPEGRLEDITKIFPGNNVYGIFVDPIKVEYLVKDENDLNKLKYIFPDPAKADLSGIAHINEVMGHDGLASIYVFGLLGYRGGEGRNMQDLMVDYYENKDFLKNYLDILHLQLMKETKEYLEAGAEVILGSNFYEGISSGWSPQIYKDIFLPLYKKQIDLVHDYGALYLYFDDGRMSANIDNFTELGMDILTTIGPPPMGDTDLKTFKEKIGDKICLMGHIDLFNVILNGTPEQIDDAVFDAIKTAAPGGGFIIGTNDCIRDETPVENVKAYFKACNKYGDYSKMHIYF
jgi:uroporphyrinogen decarboxylase